MASGDIQRAGLVRPRCNLHLCHRSPEAGGGRWARDFSRSDPFSDNLILESVGDPGLPIAGYHLLDGRIGRVIESLHLHEPISESAVSLAKYRGLIEALDVDNLRHLYISSLIGHEPKLMELGIPVTIVHQDFDPCRELRDRYLQATAARQVTHVAPSHALVHAIRKADPRFQEVSFAVIENGIDAAPDCFGEAPDGRRLRVAVLGAHELSQEAGLFSQSFEALRLLADLYLVGSDDFGRSFESRWRVTVMASRDEEIPAVLRDISPDVGLLFSALPESDAYGLLEFRVRGIPPAAPRHGTYPACISHCVDGFLFDPDGASLMTLLARLDARREELRRVARRLRRRLPPTVGQMVCRYYALRQSLAGELDRILARHG